MIKTTRACIIIVSMLVFLGSKASAYCIIGNGCPQSGTGWLGAAATFNSNGFNGSNSTFDSAFVDALNSWNNLSNFSYSNISGSVDPCGGPNGTRGWKFDFTYCGTPFGGSTLAIALTWASSFSPSINNIIDADITFNSAKIWDVHNGPGANIDFRRVAVHELGHALGLDHDDTSSAIMNTFYSQIIEMPQADDIDGLTALYGDTPLPDIKVNSSDGPLTPIDNLSVTVAIDPGSRSGDSADWWVAADTPFGWFYFDASTMSWTYTGASYTDLSPTYQGSLFDLSAFEVLNMSGLPDGTYTFYFAVDTNMNGVLDFGELFFDSVVVNITP